MNSAAHGEPRSPDPDDGVDRTVNAATEGLDREQLVELVAHLRDEVRAAQSELGELRGDYAELHVQLIRARQDQEFYQRWIDRWRQVEHNAQRVESRLRRTVRRR